MDSGEPLDDDFISAVLDDYLMASLAAWALSHISFSSSVLGSNCGILTGFMESSIATMKKKPEQISSPTHSDLESLHDVTCIPAVRGDGGL